MRRSTGWTCLAADVFHWIKDIIHMDDQRRQRFETSIEQKETINKCTDRHLQASQRGRVEGAVEEAE